MRIASFAALLLSLLILVPAAAGAHEGHDHDAPPPKAAGPALPMFEATGTDLEVAGIVQGGQLVLWIDRFADNAPVTDAVVEVGIAGGAMAKATARADGSFSVPAAGLGKPGTYEILVTVAGSASDLLVGSMTIGDGMAGDEHGHGVPWAWVVGAFLAGAVAVAAALAGLGRRTRVAALGGAALLTALAAVPTDLSAHEGHDHEPKGPVVVAADAPRRLPDGSLFVPKRTQRMLEVRTTQVAEGAVARTLSAVGRIAPDPNASGKVQPNQSGRLEPPPGGLPMVGQKVEAGQVLAYVVPSVDTVARGDVQERLAAVEKDLVIARRQVARLDKLSGVVAEREIEDARALVAGLERQRAALNPALLRREELIAPVGGIVAASAAVPGLVIDDRGAVVIFEVVDPSSLLVEAVSFDPAGGEPTGRATARLPDGRPLELAFLGRGPSLRDGAAPLLFRVTTPPANLAVGTPVRVDVEVAGELQGMAVPRESIVRGTDGLPQVWVRTSPQRFEAKQVRFQTLDASTVVVTAGLEDGDRVVTRAAGLLNQVR